MPLGIWARYCTEEGACPALGSNAMGIFPRSGSLGDGVAVGPLDPGMGARSGDVLDLPVPATAEDTVPDSVIIPKSARSAKAACRRFTSPNIRTPSSSPPDLCMTHSLGKKVLGVSGVQRDR